MERWEQFQGVYVHTPFCLQKCLYCDFPSYAGFTEEVRQRYADALCREIEVRSLQKELPVAKGATVYFGGGTPTVLAAEQVGKIVSTLKHCGWWKEPAEATIEANPGTVDAAKLKALREIGFDRISLGVQSLQDKELRALGRIHTAEQALQAIEEAKQAGFRRINADLMSGIPCQTVESFRNTLDTVLQLGLSHISVYSLILEEGTPLERLAGEGRAQLPDEESSYVMYEMTTEVLAQAGLQRYEISNYAVPGEESLHNIVYWHYEPYAAFGVGACTFDGKERRTNTADVQEYIKGWNMAEVVSRNSGTVMRRTGDLEDGGEVGEGTLWESEDLDRKTQISEALFMGLRTTEGIELRRFEKRYGISVQELYQNELTTLKAQGMIDISNRYLHLTSDGMRFGNRVFETFV
jgi:oxygen-independent coproporphyrinogen-3 oxidase